MEPGKNTLTWSSKGERQKGAVTRHMEVSFQGEGVLGVWGVGEEGCGIISLSLPRCQAHSCLQEDSLLPMSWGNLLCGTLDGLLSMTIIGASCIEYLLDARYLTHIITLNFDNILSR